MRVPVFWAQARPVFQVDIDTPYFIFELPKPDYDQRLALWQQHLAALPQSADLSFSAVASKFTLTDGQINAAAQQVAAALKTRPPDEQLVTGDDLHQAARWCSNQALRELARKIEPKHSWSDAILSPLCARQLHEMYLSVKHRHVVYSQWGFDDKLAYGKGVTALFYGPSGTGKTMVAGILARELGLDLYQIDLSTVVSKYIGETEQNLSRIFHAAEASNAILFFDEADALFGKRSEVKDARDRYANIEVAYLLQKMEEYDGIAILATNLHGNMDEAFARRLHHTVEFKQPDVRMREQLWRGVFPAQTPLSPQLDFTFLARQFDLSGGNIRNAALSAAFLAADADQPVSMEMIVTAIARELQKMGKLSTRDVFQHYYAALQQD
jgi:SpoVK/Ycf46/Vps4 family AAA+-type ATPase